jgi:Kef-type K+ transport system membrane component KefB
VTAATKKQTQAKKDSSKAQAPEPSHETETPESSEKTPSTASALSNQNRASTDRAGTAFVVMWTLLVVGGLVLALAARILGYEDSPFYVTYLFALVVAISSVILVIVGCFMFDRGLARHNTSLKRNSLMCIILGVFMLVAHFVFKGWVPLIFG